MFDVDAADISKDPDVSRMTLKSYFPPDEPIVVTFSFRGRDASRHIQNVEEVTELLQFNISKSTAADTKLVFRSFLSSNSSVTYQQQIQLMATSHIVIR